MKWAKLGGKRFNIMHEKVMGLCDTPGGAPTIYIDPTIKGMDHLITVLHEGTHGLRPNWSEAEVESFSADLGRLAWRIGYRRMKENESE